MSKLFATLVFINIAFIWYNGLQDAEASSQASRVIVEVTEDVLTAIHVEVSQDELTQVIRSLAHVIQYLSLGIFSTLWMLSMKKSFGYLYLSGLVMISDEWLQTFAPGRAFEWSDIGLDMLGFSLGIMFIVMLTLGRKLLCVES